MKAKEIKGEEKMKKRIWNIWLNLMICLTIGSSVYGEILTVEVTGIVDSVETTGGLAFDGSIGVGSEMTGLCTYDTDTPDLSPSEYNGKYALISTSITVGNYTFTHNPISSATFRVATEEAVVFGKGVYRAGGPGVRFEGTIFVDGLPQTYDDITWPEAYSELFDLWTSSEECIPTDALPDLESWPDFSAFDLIRNFWTSFDDQSSLSFDISGEVTSLTITPEPATLLLLSLGALFLRRRR
jgi:hypothetical protein